MTPSDRTEPTDLAIQAHADHIERRHGEVPVDGLTLWDVANPSLHSRESRPEQANGTTHSRHQIEARLDHRALSGTVRTDHRRQHAPRNVEIEIPEDRAAVIRDGHVMNRDRRLRIMLGADRSDCDGDDGPARQRPSVSPRDPDERQALKPPSGTSPPSARAIVEAL